MITTYLSELMLGLKGILDHYPLTDKINIYEMLIGYSPHLFSKENCSEYIRNYNIGITEVRKRKRKNSCSKFQETSPILWCPNALSFLYPIFHSLLVDCNFFFKTQPNCSSLSKCYQLPRECQYLKNATTTELVFSSSRS